MSERRYLPETMGPGCAFLDFDNDGWMDMFLVNSGPSDFWAPAKPVRNARYKNNRDGTFTDVTAHAGIRGVSFGMGVAVGDFDNDGFPDLFVTAYGRPALYHNNGDGTFTDVSENAGLGAWRPLYNCHGMSGCTSGSAGRKSGCRKLARHAVAVRVDLTAL